MLIFLPIHRTTPGLDQIAKEYIRRGSCPEHELRICSLKEDEELAYQLGDAFADHFKKVSTVTLPDTPKPRNGIKLANEMLLSAIKWLYQHQPAEGQPQDVPLIYLDPTYRPERTWVDGLQSEFYLKGCPPVMARTTSSGQKDTFKRLTEGPVIFGKRFQSALLDFLDDKEHWRSRMCHELAKDCVETRQIGSGAKSLLKPGKIVKVPA